jgi:cation diffusion facilitator family transporter
MSDFLASILTYFSILKSSKPADKHHPFGHGKYEDLSGFIEGCLIILASIFIIYDVLKKLFVTSDLSVNTMLGICVMGVSTVLNAIVSSYLFKVAKRTNSISLFADGEHLRTDMLSSLGILTGLVVIKFTHLYILDPIIALVVAIFVFRAGLNILGITKRNLLDGSIPEEDLDKICKLLDLYVDNGISGYKDLKACKIGSDKKLEVTLIFQKDLSIQDCHNTCDVIENTLEKEFGTISTSIHFEPKK